MSLNKKAVLVKPKFGQWEPFKRDRTVTDAVAGRFGANEDAGNYNKRLIDKGVLKPIQHAFSTLYTKHRDMTIPWTFEGVAMLPNDLVFEYTEHMRSGKDRIETLVDNLCNQFEIHKANQIPRLGSLYNPDDFPTCDEIRAKYYVEWQFFPVPAADHFLIDSANVDVARMKRELEQNLVTAQQNAVKNIYERVTDILDHMHERLADPQHVFRDSLVENVEALVKVLPALNMFNDEKLAQACRDMQSKILIADAQTLREDMKLREQVANEAFDLVNLLRGKEEKKAA